MSWTSVHNCATIQDTDMVVRETQLLDGKPEDSKHEFCMYKTTVHGMTAGCAHGEAAGSAICVVHVCTFLEGVDNAVPTAVTRK